MKKLAFYSILVAMLSIPTFAIEDELAKTESNITNIEQSISEISATVDQNQQTLNTLRSDNVSINNDVNQLSSNLGALQQYLKANVVFDKNGVRFIEQEGKLTLVMDNNVTFDFNKYDVKEDFKEVLMALASGFKTYDNTNIEIVGNADNIGSAEYNQELSEKRAEEVKKFLVENEISEDRVMTKGDGFNNPVASNDTEEGRALNRRIEIHITQ